MKNNLFIACIFLLSAVLYSANSYAGIAYPYPVKITQTDGTVITVILQGDERIKWAKTTDGYTLLYNDYGVFEYAKLDASGNLVPSGIKAHDLAERAPTEASFLSTVAKNLFYNRTQVSTLLQISNIYPPTDAITAFPTTGNAKLLCILIGYSDLAFTETQANFNNLFNQVGYGTYGSVKDYYEENSYGQFHLTVDVAGPYTASETKAYYGANNASGDDIRPRELVTEAVNLADPDVNYADYDNDNNGSVDGVYVIYAGYNEAEGGGADCIWYHAWSIPTVTLDGKDISAYSCSAEYKGNSGTNISGIGNICHEFGHVLGAPDFYDTDYGTGGQYGGLGGWCTMSSGNFNGDRDCPAHYNPFIKYHYYGWAPAPPILNSQTEMTILNSTDNADQFFRYNTTTTDEFFIFENRQQTGFDEFVPGHGLLIYHAHKDLLTGGINKTHPQKFYPVCANAGTEPSATAADYGNINSNDVPFPGNGNKTKFTDATIPSSKAWDGSNTGYPIDFITENPDGSIFLCFMGCAPVADFMADETNPCTGNTVYFSDLSEYEPTSWAWEFTPNTVSFTGGTNASSQNPQVIFNEAGDYTVKLTATNDYGSDEEIKVDYIEVDTEPVVTLHPSDYAAEWGDDVSFTADATGIPTPTVQWQRSTNGGSTFLDISGETNLTLNLSCVTLEMDGYQYQAVFTNRCGVAVSDPAELSVVPKSIAGTVTIAPNPQQYSDIVDISVEITDGYTCGEMAATGADIYIGTQYMGTVNFSVSGSDLTATLSDVYLLEPTPFGTLPTGQMAPGNHLVTAELLNVNTNFSVSDPTAILNILQEDARATYTGVFYTSTQGVNSDEAIVTLSATIKDITAVDPGSDPDAGDIRNATLSFVDRDGGSIATDVPIGLVDPNDPTVAVGTTDWNVTIAGDAEDFTIGVVVDGYYVRNSSEDDIIVTVAKPLPNFVTGGGYITLESPAGMVAGDVGSKNNFGFNVRFNKNGTNLRGKVNTIIRRTEWDGVHTYQIKGNKINSLAILPDDEGGEATINCKASIEDITDPLNPVSVEGNASMQINMDDNGEPGVNDLIAITIWDKWGGLWYASNWNGTRTNQQLLDGGNLAVHSDGSFKSFAAVNDGDNTSDNGLSIAPNPNNGQFTIMFEPVLLPGSRVLITDMKGQVIDEFLLNTNAQNIDIKGSVRGIYQVIVFNGSVVYKAKVAIN
ncbi:MAG: M6 family metalloprotease domain-containing protein [Bacteroidales bacterium]|nr:M6 family metalloprotease domain-containing protein [Bacteroidales bacterium]